MYYVVYLEIKLVDLAMENKAKGRPATKPVTLREGYYLELKSGSSTIKLRRNSMAEIEMATRMYEKSKVVTYLGQVKDGKWLDGKNKGKKVSS